MVRKAARVWSGRTPHAWQERALDAVTSGWAAGRSTLVSAPTGAGKSLLLAELAATEPGAVLVTTPSRFLVDQLAAALEARIPGEVGRVATGVREADRRVVVCCTASLASLLTERASWALWLEDEAHTAESDIRRGVRDRVQRERLAGLTATPYRGDDRGLLGWDDVHEYIHAHAVRDNVIVPHRTIRWEGEGDPDVDALTGGWVAAADGPGIVCARDIADAEETAARLGLLAVHSGMQRAEIAKRFRACEQGKARGIVHVDLVTEGVDLPWLRWIVLRARTASRRRLRQMVGRALRVWPGKTEAVLYDPHDLIRRVGLYHDPALNDAPEPDAAPVVRIEALGDHETAGMPLALAVAWWEGWASDRYDDLLAGKFPMPPFPARLTAAGAAPAKPELRAALVALLPRTRFLAEADRVGPAWLAAYEGLTARTATECAVLLRAGGGVSGD